MRRVSPVSRPYDRRFTAQMVMRPGIVTPRAPDDSHRTHRCRSRLVPRRRVRLAGRHGARSAHRDRVASEAAARAGNARVQAHGQPDRRRGALPEVWLQELPHARRSARHGHGRAESRPGQAGLPPCNRPRHAREGRDAVVQGPAVRPADRRRRLVRRQVVRRHPVELPEGFPAHVAAFACDLDRTLVAADLELRPRTRKAIARVRAAGTHVVVVTGRMFRSVRRYLEAAALDDPVVCYQGALIADPVTGAFLRHVPIPLAAAHEALDAVIEAGFHINAYVDDELYVAAPTPEAHAYADLNQVQMHVVGDLREWLREPPTKLVAVGDPLALDELEAVLKPRFAGKLFVSKSLP